MNIQDVIHWAFLGQVIVLSYYFPRVILRRTKAIFQQYPPTNYPKLYPISLDAIYTKMAIFKFINMGILLIGIAIVTITMWLNTDELLTWDNQAVIALYFILQGSPMIWATFAGVNYAKKMRLMNQSNIRKATLQPRQLNKLFPIHYLIVLLASHLSYIATVVYFTHYPFDGFAGYTNLFGLLLIDAFFGALFYYSVFMKKNDPTQSSEDQNKDMVRNTHILLVTLIAVIIKLIGDLFLSGFNLRSYQDIVTIVYFILIVSFSVYNYRFDSINFERYR